MDPLGFFGRVSKFGTDIILLQIDVFYYFRVPLQRRGLRTLDRHRLIF